jgi:hypothetical protein
LALTGAWFLPSSDFRDFLRRVTGGSYEPPSETTATTIEITDTENQQLTMVPQTLLDLGVYDEASDFVNEAGIKPTGWEHPNDDPSVWGPCRFVPKVSQTNSVAKLEWSDRRRQQIAMNGGASNATYSPDYYRNADPQDFEYMRKPKGAVQPFGDAPFRSEVTGWCRPGFLIIGAGKCGTSSLYHYLIGHPRVLPAVEKQIHYFKYKERSPLEYYYGWFPTPQSFLEHGGLVAGEASPGYMPYPDVARNAYMSWKGNNTSNGAGVGSDNQPLRQFLARNSHESMIPEVPPRIIAIGREPLDRIYSSYKYNYVVPTIESLRTRGHPRLSKSDGFKRYQKDDDYYKPYLFTLEDFVRAELKQLRGCLFDWGPQKTYDRWKSDAIYDKALKVRNGSNNNFGGDSDQKNNTSSLMPPPLIDLDGVCYGKTVSRDVYREQWQEMQTGDSKKVLLNKNLHLTQAFIGRSLYTFPLEWWYLLFRPDPSDESTENTITFVCTEDVAKPDTLHDLTSRLGLPRHEGFDEILAEGAYNVGGHRGYDKATSWEEIELEQQPKSSSADSDEPTSGKEPMTNGLPLPEDLYKELKEFIDPMNERLFALTGKRCDW